MRKAKPAKRYFLPDPKYKDVLVTRFVNNIMKDGKKSIAYTIFYGALDFVEEKMKDTGESAMNIFKKALENVVPQVEVRSKRIGGASFQVPTEIPANRKLSIGMKNMILFAFKRTGKSMMEKLGMEIISAFKNEGGAFKKKEDIHRLAEANKAFSHYRY